MTLTPPKLELLEGVAEKTVAGVFGMAAYSKVKGSEPLDVCASISAHISAVAVPAVPGGAAKVKTPWSRDESATVVTERPCLTTIRYCCSESSSGRSETLMLIIAPPVSYTRYGLRVKIRGTRSSKYVKENVAALAG